MPLFTQRRFSGKAGAGQTAPEIFSGLGTTNSDPLDAQIDIDCRICINRLDHPGDAARTTAAVHSAYRQLDHVSLKKYG